MYAHLNGLRGHGLAYRDEVIDILKQLHQAPSQQVQVYRKTLRGIQFAFAGSEKNRYLSELLELVNDAIEKNTEKSADLTIFRAELCLALEELKKMVNEVENIPDSAQPPFLKRSLQKVAKKITAANYPDFNAPKVFGIGLSRTATSSLHESLKILGLHALHWNNPHTQKIISNSDFLLFDAFTDISVSYQFEELYHAFPNSRFIFTTRSIPSWVKSITNHYHATDGITSPKELSLIQYALRYGGVVDLIHRNLYTQYESWEEAYLHFDHRVRNFFSDKPTNRFLELNICDGEGWEKLCQFLDKPIPDVPFPNENKGQAHIVSSNP